MVVPRSSQLVTQDGEHALVTVTLFRKVVDEFKHHAREQKYGFISFKIPLAMYPYFVLFVDSSFVSLHTTRRNWLLAKMKLLNLPLIRKNNL